MLRWNWQKVTLKVDLCFINKLLLCFACMSKVALGESLVSSVLYAGRWKEASYFTHTRTLEQRDMGMRSKTVPAT